MQNAAIKAEILVYGIEYFSICSKISSTNS